MAYKVKKLKINKQANTDRTYYASWAFEDSHCQEFKVRWWYATGDGIWFGPEEKTTTYYKARKNNHSSTYTPPENAKKIYVTVLPKSKEDKVETDANGKEVKKAWWTGTWVKTDALKIDTTADDPEAPETPSVSISGNTLTVSIENYSYTARDGKQVYINFEVIQNETEEAYTEEQISAGGGIVYGYIPYEIKYGRAYATYTIAPGNTYKARARAIIGTTDSGPSARASDWTSYSESVMSAPSTPKNVNVIALSDTMVRVFWDSSPSASSHTVQYISYDHVSNSLYAIHPRDIFDLLPQDVQEQNVPSGTSVIISGLTQDVIWCFRVKAIGSGSDAPESGWSEPAYIALESGIDPPTTWSTLTTVVAGDPVTLCWVHNSQSGRAQGGARLTVKVNSTTTVYNLTTETTYTLNTNGMTDGTVIQWSVRTTNDSSRWSDESVVRTINVFAAPSLGISGIPSVVTSFPISPTLSMSSNRQNAVSFHVRIFNRYMSYDVIDDAGGKLHINPWQEIYSKWFVANAGSNQLTISIGPGDVNLENGIDYQIRADVATDAGMSATVNTGFTTNWDDFDYDIDADVTIGSREACTTVISPIVKPATDTGNRNVIIYIYRREFDGNLKLIKSHATTTALLDGSFHVDDPHPSLDYARYRLVVQDYATGSISFYDVPGHPVQEKAIILQWSEEQTVFDIHGNEDDMFTEGVDGEITRPTFPWRGSLLRLPYNIDVSDKNNLDVNMTEYIGRRHPVSYYGTQVGQSATWNVDIPLKDLETLYTLRRLSVFMGDVYVREPSGSGYWAHIGVSFKQEHCKVVIPVTLELTRVEGGV